MIAKALFTPCLVFISAVEITLILSIPRDGPFLKSRLARALESLKEPGDLYPKSCFRRETTGAGLKGLLQYFTV
jgi:hypothetical protein